ncbi:MAG: lytic murein transglycosylase, partial [Caulobacterales bacterium]
MLNRLFMMLAAGAFLQVAAPGVLPLATPPGVASSADFDAWRTDFERRMKLAAHNETAIKQVMDGVAVDERVEKHLVTQAEFTKPLWSYVQDRLSKYSIDKGRASMAQNAALFSAIEARYGAPKEIVAAIWGMESGYGAFTGNIDAPAALATMAMHLDRRAFAERQLEALIAIVERNYATRAQLKGSWSAAMGHTQFIPTTYLERAVDWNGDGKKDFWSTPDDALAST